MNTWGLPERRRCSVVECGMPHLATGLCRIHYARLRRTGTTDAPKARTQSDADRFWSKVRKTKSGCWLWKAGRFPNGYGQFWLIPQSVAAHRYAWELTRGRPPKGLQLDHLCRVRRCVNPDHLELVSCKTNLLRGQTKAAANAAKTHCPRGHPYSAANTYFLPGGRRRCRICGRAACARRQASLGLGPTNAEKTHCPRGHAYTPMNTYLRADGRGRRCRICTLATNRASVERNRASD